MSRLWRFVELATRTFYRFLRRSNFLTTRETTGTSFTARLTELRLQRAFALLTEARDGKGRISDIALQVGFWDISHFNRLFRSRFGDTPSGVRGVPNLPRNVVIVKQRAAASKG